MKIATWNVNGIRARQAQLLDWLAAEKPDIVCLQEIKASLDQLTFELRDVDGYWSYWHGEKGYSGVALLRREVARRRAADVLASGLRLRAADRVRDRALARRRRDDRVGLRAERRQGLRRQDAVPAGARGVRRRRESRRQAGHPVRRPERRAGRARHSSEAAQAESDRRARPKSARCSRGSFRTAWSMCIARSSPTTTTCSPGGRRGAT